MFANLVFAGGLQDLLVADLVHELEALKRLLDGDADVLLRERAGAERVVEHEEPLGGVDAHERSHVVVVGQGGRQPHQPHHLLRPHWLRGELPVLLQADAKELRLEYARFASGPPEPVFNNSKAHNHGKGVSGEAA